MVILALDMTIIVPIAVFGLFAAGAWFLTSSAIRGFVNGNRPKRLAKPRP